MHHYIYKCRYCRAAVEGSLFMLPLKIIRHEWSAHQKLFTESWNPVNIIRRMVRTVRERKNDEFLSSLTKGKGNPP